MARVWFFRQTDPTGGDVSAGTPITYANGASVSDVPQGTAVFHDFPPGKYRFTVQPYGTPTREHDTLLLPGTQSYVQVQWEANWEANRTGGGSSFTVLTSSPVVAQQYLPTLTNLRVAKLLDGTRSRRSAHPVPICQTGGYRTTARAAIAAARRSQLSTPAPLITPSGPGTGNAATGSPQANASSSTPTESVSATIDPMWRRCRRVFCSISPRAQRKIRSTHRPRISYVDQTRWSPTHRFFLIAISHRNRGRWWLKAELGLPASHSSIIPIAVAMRNPLGLRSRARRRRPGEFPSREDLPWRHNQ
jgi:hypothetical protein